MIPENAGIAQTRLILPAAQRLQRYGQAPRVIVRSGGSFVPRAPSLARRELLNVHCGSQSYRGIGSSRNLTDVTRRSAYRNSHRTGCGRKGQRCYLQRKLSAVEAAKLEIEARLATANHALERLSSFVSMRGRDLQCPRCWINNKVIATLRPASDGPSGHDKFRCETCKGEFNLQI
jgi:hypothetical protein